MDDAKVSLSAFARPRKKAPPPPPSRGGPRGQLPIRENCTSAFSNCLQALITLFLKSFGPVASRAPPSRSAQQLLLVPKARTTYYSRSGGGQASIRNRFGPPRRERERELAASPDLPCSPSSPPPPPAWTGPHFCDVREEKEPKAVSNEELFSSRLQE